MDVRVEVKGDRVYLYSPYNALVPPAAKAIGGRWDANSRVWHFDLRDEQRVHSLVREIFGTDGDQGDGDLVTVRIHASEHEGDRDDPHVRFAGRIIARRDRRDGQVWLARGVVLVAGEFDRSGGSMRFPRINADEDVVLEIRDLPRSALDIEADDSYTIVTETIDVEALVAERERLLARIAEIDAALPEPAGTEMTTRQAAQALGVSVRTVQRWAQKGQVAATKNASGTWTITITV